VLYGSLFIDKTFGGGDSVSANKYPIEKTRYLQSVGKLLPHRICQILNEMGYKTWMNPRQNNGVDIEVWHNNTLILVIEVLNWSIGSMLSKRRASNIISNLNQYTCAKAVIHTVLGKNDIQKFEDEGIITLKIGYQLLPKYFYRFFSRKGQTRKRKIDSRETKEDMREKIQALMHKVMTISEEEINNTYIDVETMIKTYASN